MTVKSNQTRGFRLVSSQPITADLQQFTIDLPRGPHIESVLVKIGGTFAITTLYTAVRNIAAYRYLRRADFVLNSNVTMDSVSGPMLAQLYVTRRTYPATTVPSGFTVAAGYSFEASFLFDRAIMDMMRPKDSMLKTDVGISNLQLRLQLGALSDLFQGAGVCTYTSVTMTVSVLDYQEAKGKDGSTPKPMFYAKRNGSTYPFTGAQTGQQIKLNTGNRLRIVSIRVLDGTTLEPSALLLSKIGIKRAGDQRVDVNASDLLRLNQATYGVALLTGQYVWDFANSGQLVGCRYSEFWPIPSNADTFLVVDVTASCQLEVVTLEGVDL